MEKTKCGIQEPGDPRRGRPTGILRTTVNGDPSMAARRPTQTERSLQEGHFQEGETDRLFDVGKCFKRRFRKVFMDCEIGLLKILRKISK